MWFWSPGWLDILGGSQLHKKDFFSDWKAPFSQSHTLYLECLNEVSRQGCTSLRPGLWQLPQLPGDIPCIPGLTAWVATGPQGVGSQQTPRHSSSLRDWSSGVFLLLSHGNVSALMCLMMSDYNLAISLDSSLKSRGFPHIPPHAVDKTKQPPSACKIGLIIIIVWFSNLQVTRILMLIDSLCFY